MTKWSKSISFRVGRNWRNAWPLQVLINWWHFDGTPGGGCRHGPRSQSWPWWKLGSWLWCNLNPHPPCSGRRLWVYTRWGAFHIDAVVDRRDLQCIRCGAAKREDFAL